METVIDILLQNLKNWGCDVDGALNRFLGETELYQQCLNTITEDKAFDELGKALDTGDVKAGFEAAHTLKGVLANLGLTPMYEVVVEIVEPLRAGNANGLQPYYTTLMVERDYLKRLLEVK